MRNEKMEKVVDYYLGAYAESISPVVLYHLALRLDSAHVTYYCFWAFLIKHWEPNKLIHRNFLESARVWDRFQEERKDKESRIRMLVGLDLDRFLVMSDIYTPAEVLLDEDIKIGPVIRYAMAHCLGFPKEPYEKYRLVAIQQLREEPLLFDHLEKIKEGFPITKEAVMRNE